MAGIAEINKKETQSESLQSRIKDWGRNGIWGDHTLQRPRCDFYLAVATGPQAHSRDSEALRRQKAPEPLIFALRIGVLPSRWRGDSYAMKARRNEGKSDTW